MFGAQCTHVGMAGINKAERIYIRVKADVKEDLSAAAEMDGVSMSSFLTFLATKAIRDAKEKHPAEFEAAKQKIKKPDPGSRRLAKVPTGKANQNEGEREKRGRGAGIRQASGSSSGRGGKGR